MNDVRRISLRSASPAVLIVGMATCTFDTSSSPPEPCIGRSLVMELGRLSDSTSVRGNPLTIVRRTSTGEYMVWEFNSSDILRYDQRGEFAGHLGRFGSGPGEVRIPVSFMVDPTDSIWVTEYGGKVTVFSSTDDGARVLSDRWDGFSEIQTFTSEGSPVILRAPRYGSTIQIRDRSGTMVATLGKSLDIPASGSASLLGVGRVVMLSDTAALVSLDPLVLEHWTPGAVTVAFDSSQLMPAFREAAPGIAADSVAITAIMKGDDGALWGLAVRRVAAWADLPTPPGREGPGLSLKNRDHVWNTLLWRWDLRRNTVNAFEVQEPPAGFVDGRHFFTFRETDAGLVVVQIWRMDYTCN